MNKINFRLIFSGVLIFLIAHTVIGQRASIILGTEDWPPFSYKEKAKQHIAGLSTDVINETFKRMGVTVTRNKIFPWVRAQKNVYEGLVDAVYTASINDIRKKYCYFSSEPIITTTWFLFIQKSKKGVLVFEKLSDLKKKKVGLIRGYNYPPEFKNYIMENSVIQTVSKEIQNIAKLIVGRYEYMPAVAETTFYLAKNSPMLKKLDAYNNLYYFPTPLGTADFYLIFSKKTVKKAFVDRFSKALIEFKKTDKYQKILKKYATFL